MNTELQQRREEVENTPIKRYLFPIQQEIKLDRSGLLILPTNTYFQPNAVDINQAVSMTGGIVIAEGGMGKTTWLQQLSRTLPDKSSLLIRLSEYIGDPNGLRSDIDSFSNKASSKTIIFDGLDEAPSLAGFIQRYLRQTTLRIWITSRYIAEINSVSSERSDLAIFRLAPLSEEDIRTRANQSGIDPDAFVVAARKQSILPLCAKPIGLNLALSEYDNNGLVGVTQGDLWNRGIKRLCDETSSCASKTKEKSKFSVEDIFSCSAWIAMCQLLTGSQQIWLGLESAAPDSSCLPSNLATPQFSLDLIHSALGRGIFHPLGDERISFSHAVYRDFLAAYGFHAFLPVKSWASLLLNPQRDGILPQYVAVAAWLSTRNAAFLATVVSIQPEILLMSADSLQTAGPTTICSAFLDRAENLSYQQRNDASILENLFRLHDAGTIEILKSHLTNPETSPTKKELATTIAEACGYDDLADVFCDHALNAGLPLRERIDAAYAVCKLANGNAKSRMIGLLGLKSEEDPQDDLKGLCLRACWPRHMQYTDILPHLTKPKESNYTGPYSVFLGWELPKHLNNTLTVEYAPAFLEWSCKYIAEHDPFESFGKLARTIFTICWKKWGTIPSVSRLLAQGFLKASAEYQSPFLREKSNNDGLQPLTWEAFNQEKDKRIHILKIILAQSNREDRLISRHLWSNDFPLFTHNDLERLFDEAFATTDNNTATNLCRCIRPILRSEDATAYKGHIDQLNQLYPNHIDNADKIHADMMNEERKNQEIDRQLKRERVDHIARSKQTQNRIDKKIKAVLNSLNPRPDFFPGLSDWLNSSNGSARIELIDLQKTEGWEKLSRDGREVLTDLAHKYLLENISDPTPSGKCRYTEANAMTLLRLRRPNVFADLPESAWEKAGPELIKAALGDINDLLQPLLDTMSRCFPRIATQSLIYAIRQEMETGHVSSIKHWNKRLNDEQARAILDLAMDPASTRNRTFTLMNELVENGRDKIVRENLRKVFERGWGEPPSHDYDRLRRLAFALEPSRYISDLCKIIDSNPEWGREWMESTLDDYGKGFWFGLQSCDAEEIGTIYKWLHIQYPESTRPHHTAGYSPGPLDRIHELKSQIILFLAAGVVPGSAKVLGILCQFFPNDGWLKDCLLEAKTKELARSAPMLSIAEIKEICRTRELRSCVCNSATDLMDIVQEALNDYQTYLQGDTPAVRDLWDTGSEIQPRDEEYLSDHLKRYLDLRLTTGVITNREVQIRRKHIDGGESGRRIDLWIQAIGSDKGIITLCIEVKCNWNSSAKTALKEQLIEKYMSGGTASAGILLLAWFACDKWSASDQRKRKSTSVWPNVESATQDLIVQVSQEKISGIVCNTMVLICSLT